MNHAAVIADRATRIRNGLNLGDKAQALRVLVENPPYNCPDPKLRMDDVRNVVQALASFKGEQQIDQALGGISDDEVDILMKYIYAGLSTGESSKELLVWHAAVQKRSGGLGSIIRVLSDTTSRI